MVLTIIPFSAFANDVNNVVFDYDGYRVSYNVSDSWANNQNVSVTITNTGDKSIRNWALQYDLCGTAANIWNGEIYSDNIIKNANYNSDIAAGESVNFGYTITNSTGIPDKFSLCSYDAEKATGFTTELNIQNSWDTGFNGIIKITNTTDKPIMAWNLSFKSNFDILNSHNFNIMENLNNYYKIFGTSNGNIPAFSSIEIGFTGSGTEHPEITNIAMTESLIKGTTESITYIEDENSDIGEVYFKEVDSWDNTDYYQDICFARNQLLLTAHDNVSFQDISDLADSLNASIVGYIELTNDYQIEFNEDVTADYLNMVISELMQNYMIEYAALNIVVESEEDADNIDSFEWSDWEKSVNNWHLYDANIIKAWNNNSKARNVSVKMGVIDSFLSRKASTYLNYETIWNKCKTIPQYNFNCDYNDKDKAPGNSMSHGTHVAGIIAGKFNLDNDTSGVCPGSKLYGFAYYGENKSLSSIMKYKTSLALLIGNNIKVINVSLCEKDESHETIENGAESIKHFLNKLIDKKYDFVIVSSAGNQAKKNIPAKYNSFLNYIALEMNFPDKTDTQNSGNASSRIIVVGSMYKDGTIDSNCCKGFEILAPGELIYSTVAGNGYLKLSGTSMATPIVSGIAGMIYEVNPNIRGDQVKKAILTSGAPATGENKKVDAYAAIKEARILTNDEYSEVTGKVILLGTVSVEKFTQEELLNKKIKVCFVDSDETEYYRVSDVIVKDNYKDRGQFHFILDNDKFNNKNKREIIIELELDLGGEMIYKSKPIELKKEKNVFVCNIRIVRPEAKDNFTKMPLDNVSFTLDRIEKENAEGSGNSDNSDDMVYDYNATSDELGRFVVNLPDGEYKTTFTKDGYQPLEMVIQITDGVMYDNGKILEGVYLTPIESAISGMVTEYNKTKKTTKPLSGVEVAVYKESDPGSIVASTTTSSDGTYSITLKEQGNYIVKFRNEKQESISVSGGNYNVNATFEVEDKIPIEDDGDEEDEKIDVENINLNFDGSNSTAFTGTLTGDLTNGMWFTTDKGYYINVYTTDTTGKYAYSLVTPDWGAYTYSTNNWDGELKIATYNSKGTIIADYKLDYFYQNHSIYGKYIDYDTYKIMGITSINFTKTGISYTMHTDGYYTLHSNCIGSLSFIKEDPWEEDEVSTLNFYKNSKITSVSTEKPF